MDAGAALGPRWVFALAAITVVVMALFVAHLSLRRPISGDEAYNLQIAKSIGYQFCYCTRYLPVRVFPIEGSTNGIAQYVGGAIFAWTHNPDYVKAGTVALATLVLGGVLYALDAWLVFLGALLFFVWYALVYVSVNFLGEPWAIAFSLLGILFLKKADFSVRLRALLRDRWLLLAILCFGIGMESKLLATLVVLPVTWAVSYQRTNGSTPLVRIARALCITAGVAMGAALMLLLLIGFSVSHSIWSVNASLIWQTFSEYVLNMVGQGQGQAQPFDLAHIVAVIAQFSSPIVVGLFVLACAILVYANWSYAIFVAVSLAWWLHYGGNERHVVISLYATIVLAGLEAHTLIRHACAKRNLSSAKYLSAAAAGVVACALVIGILAHNTFDAPADIKPFPDREHALQVSTGRIHYSRGLVNLLRHERYVVTSGWWQLPELSLRENLEFYDRMSPVNANLPRDHLVLVFDTGNTNWPVTSVRANCRRVLYVDAPLVVCTPRRDVPLNFQPPS